MTDLVVGIRLKAEGGGQVAGEARISEQAIEGVTRSADQFSRRLQATADDSRQSLRSIATESFQTGQAVQQHFSEAADRTRTLGAELRGARREISTLLALGDLQRVAGDILDFGDVVVAIYAGRAVTAIGSFVSAQVASVGALAQDRTAALESAVAHEARAAALNHATQSGLAGVAATGAQVEKMREEAVAASAAATAERARAASLTLGARAMSVLGGPAGLIMLGVSALSFWAIKARAAASETDALSKANSRLAESATKITRQGLAEQIVALEDMNDLYTKGSSAGNAAQRSVLDELISKNEARIAALKGQIDSLIAADERVNAIAAGGRKPSSSSGGSGRSGQTTAEWATEQAIALQRQLEDEGARVTASVRADYEILNDEVARYYGLLNADAISQETFNRLIEQSGLKFSGYSDRVGEFNKLIAEIDPALANAQRYLADYDLLASQITDPARLEAARDALIALRFKGEDVEKPAQQAADQVAQIYEDTASSIRSAFRDTFRSVFDDGRSGFKDFGDLMRDVFKDTRDVFKDMLADMATLAIAQPVIVPMVAGLGSMLGLQNSAQAAIIQQLGGGAVNPALAGAAGSSLGFSMLGTFGSGLAATLPGFLGGAGGGFGAASTLAGTAGGFAGAGALAGAALPWVAGAAILDKVTGGGLFGTDWKTKDAGLDLSISGGSVAGQEFTRQKKKRSLFRGSRSRTTFGDIDADLLTSLNDSLDVGIDALLAGAAGLGADAAEQILAGFSSQTRLSLKGKSDEEAQQLVQEWLDKTLVDMARAVTQDTRFSGLLIDATKEMAEALFTLGEFFAADPIRDFSEQQRLASRTLKQQFEEQGSALMDLARAYDGSTLATQELAAATQERYQMELALLQQISSVRAGVDSLIGGSVESIRESVMSPEQLYDYLRGQAETLAEQLTSATDPAAIEQLVSKIDTLTSRAYGLVPEDGRAEFAQQFIDFYDGVQASAQSRLDGVEQTVLQTHTDTAQIIQDMMERASARLEAAAAKQEAAALVTERAAAALEAATNNYYRYVR